MSILSKHNNLCPQGYEITLEMFISESIEIIEKNLASISKNDFMNLSVGLASSGLLENYTSMITAIESQLRERIYTLDVLESLILLKTFT